MKATTSHEELAQRIEELVRAHIAESHRVAQEAVERAFKDGRRSTRPKGARASVAKGRAPSNRRDPEEIAALGERLYAAVCAHPGEGMKVLAGEVGATARELHRPMTNLKRTGRVRSVGQRHATRYFPLATSAS